MWIADLKKTLKIITNLAKRRGKISMFSIATTKNVNNQEILFPSIRETDKTVCGNILLNSDKHINKLIKIIDGRVKIILIDSETKISKINNLEQQVLPLVKKSKVLTFRPNDITVNAADVLISQLASPLKDKKIAIIGGGNIGSKLALKLVEADAKVYLTRQNKQKLEKIVKGLNAIKSDLLKNKIYGTTNNLEASDKADVLIGTSPGIPVISVKMIKKIKTDGMVIDIGNGTLFPQAIKEAKKRNLRVLCLVMRPGYDGAIKTILETEKLVKKHKSRILGNFSIISGGVLGEKGDIIVDDAGSPTRILAIANGRGDVIAHINNSSFKTNIEKVEKLIKKGGK